ncbi:hypothetical protein LPJ59_002705, partial [Coemansia sp. RSA 2399]
MSGDSSSEHWSFENLTHSIDSSGRPLSAIADLQQQPKHHHHQQQQQQQQQNPPLSLILRNPFNSSNTSSSIGVGAPAGHNSSSTIRSPSAGSIYATRLQRQQRKYISQQRPDSFSSENFSLNYSEHNSKQHLLYSQASQNSMYATDNTSGPQAPVSPTASSSPGMRPAASMQSDRAVFVPSRQPELSPPVLGGGAAGMHNLR